MNMSAATKTELEDLYTETAKHLDKAAKLIEQGQRAAYTLFSRIARLSPDGLVAEIEGAYLDTVRALERIREIHTREPRS